MTLLGEKGRHPLDLEIPSPSSTFRIGIIGAGGIVTGSHLPAYAERGWQVVHIASRSLDAARSAAELFSIPKYTDDWHDVINDDDVQIVDVSLPPHLHPEVCRAAFAAGKHVLAQKPMTMDLQTAYELVQEAKKAGVMFAVNQNGRFDPSIMACHKLIEDGVFGELVLANMQLRTRQPWQKFWEDEQYQRLMILGMSIHHLDQFRFLFGDPEEVTAVTARYPDQPWAGESIAIYTLRYSNGFIAHGFDNGFPWTKDWRVSWGLDGTEAIAQGEIGWPTGGFSTIRYMTRSATDTWIEPTLTGKWFPDAFAGTMGALFEAVATGKEPTNSGFENLRTLRLVEACYLSASEQRTVKLKEIRYED